MKNLPLLLLTLFPVAGIAQLSPAITSWLQNTSETGTYYIEGNADLQQNNILVNCQRIEYSDDFVYVTATGVPAYPTGPFLDRNPSFAENQEAIFKIPLNPVENTGDPIATTAGNIGIFINGVALFDFRDGVGWNSETQEPCGGPGNPPCPGGARNLTDWSRDAVPAEREGFDCAKGHPAMGNYHHHQNPSAFDLDLETVSTVCNLYDADGLYALDSTTHSPLIGFAYDGFPIYGGYGFANSDGSGGIARMKSGYVLRNITQRTTKPDGSAADLGPDVDGTYYLGYFREDYAYIEVPNDESVLDEHNGRFCITPEYPNGTYAYFATVDENWNSAYPYVVGPNFYGVSERRDVDAVNEPTTVYQAVSSIQGVTLERYTIKVLPNPVSDLVAIQIEGLVEEELSITLRSITGQAIANTRIPVGGTLAHFDVSTIYPGTYIIEVTDGRSSWAKQLLVTR